jgi:hypothetical protein
LRHFSFYTKLSSDKRGMFDSTALSFIHGPMSAVLALLAVILGNPANQDVSGTDVRRFAVDERTLTLSHRAVALHRDQPACMVAADHDIVLHRRLFRPGHVRVATIRLAVVTHAVTATATTRSFSSITCSSSCRI